MRITLVLIGKTETGFVSEGIKEYENRLKHYVKFEIIILPALKKIKNLSIEMQKKKESEFIESNIDLKSNIVLLDEIGKEYTSSGYAEWLNKQINAGTDITFVVGGAYGFSDEMRKKYPKIALSKMTFSHQMVRLFFVEQIYRAFTILKGENYHH
ncbi:MAG: 23S rRNA (pseudouridine(1915)-N(3))-methyltransferase RlmH [Bacteroidales bacterium]|nr:23S rRNA (pseudouridine(1915)-N(3))-methyltransferase RlmH [Bacteroidales bacterium]